jgi:hypothetical protein
MLPSSRSGAPIAVAPLLSQHALDIPNQKRLITLGRSKDKAAVGEGDGKVEEWAVVVQLDYSRSTRMVALQAQTSEGNDLPEGSGGRQPTISSTVGPEGKAVACGVSISL